MKLKNKKLLYQNMFLMFAFMFLIGCAAQPKNIQLEDNYWENKKRKVVVSIAQPPKSQLYYQGYIGLLDRAIINVMNRQIMKSLDKTDLNWYYDLQKNLHEQLKSRQIPTLVHGKTIDTSQENYMNFASLLKGDDLLIIKLEHLGAVRRYYSIIPLSAPQAYCKMTGELINLKTKAVVWRQISELTVPVSGDWDQPPNYPNLANALKIAINTTKQELLDSLLSGH